MKKRQILIVDDSPAARDAVRHYARATGWQFFESAGVEVPLLQTDTPTLVLLDYVLGKFQQERRWLRAFRQYYPRLPCAIYLLTGREEEELAEDQQQFIAEGGLAGILKKPLDLTRLDSLLEQGLAHRGEQPDTPPPPGELLLEVMSSRSEGVRVLRATDLEEVYRNPEAARYPLDADARRWLQHLVRRLDEEGSSPAESLEWDQEHAAWLRRRILRAGRWYWLIENRSVADPQEAPGLSRLLAGRSWEERLSKMAQLLQHQWGITRLRLYQLVPLAGSEERLRYVVQPLWQRGGGFATGRDEGDWLAHEFLTDERPDLLDTSSSSGGQKAKLIHPVSDGGEREELGMVAWGDAPNVMRIVISGPAGTPLGLLSMDRRGDHLPLPPPWAEDTPWQRSLTQEDFNHMAGLLDAMREELRQVIKERQRSRREEWTRTLTELLGNHAQHPTAQEALQRTLMEFRTTWHTPGVHPRDVYLMRYLPGDHLLEPWVGVGPLWEARRDMATPLVSPFREALREVKVIHNVAQWLRDLPTRQREKLSDLAAGHPKAVEGLVSWIGLPVRTAQETIGLLVVTFPGRHYLTELRLEGLRQFAERLVPTLRWGQEEMRREWLRRALAHEYREPLTRLLHLVEGHSSEIQAEVQALVEYQWALVHNLRLIGHDSLPPPPPSSPAPGAPLAELLERIVATLTALYPDQRHAPLAEGLRQCRSLVPDSVLHQLLFNLLENACKYGSHDDPIEVRGEPRPDGLLLSVCNNTDHPIPRADAKRIFLAYERGSNASVTKGAGIGLAVARRLSDLYGLQLTLADRGRLPQRRVCFSILFPCERQLSKE